MVVKLVASRSLCVETSDIAEVAWIRRWKSTHLSYRWILRGGTTDAGWLGVRGRRILQMSVSGKSRGRQTRYDTNTYKQAAGASLPTTKTGRMVSTCRLHLHPWATFHLAPCTLAWYSFGDYPRTNTWLNRQQRFLCVCCILKVPSSAICWSTIERRSLSLRE